MEYSFLARESQYVLKVDPGRPMSVAIDKDHGSSTYMPIDEQFILSWLNAAAKRTVCRYTTTEYNLYISAGPRQPGCTMGPFTLYILNDYFEYTVLTDIAKFFLTAADMWGDHE